MSGSFTGIDRLRRYLARLDQVTGSPAILPGSGSGVRVTSHAEKQRKGLGQRSWVTVAGTLYGG